MAINDEELGPSGSSASETSPLLQAPTPSQPSKDDAQLQAPQQWVVIPVLFLGVILASMDVFFVIASGSVIASQLGALSSVDWLVNSYSISTCAVQPIFGKTSDIFGRKTMLLLSYAVFGTGCIFCGLANGLPQIMVGRAISGFGAAGMEVLVAIIIADMVPVRDIAQWRSYISMGSSIGRALGGPVGGFLTDIIGWRWSFLVQVPFVAVAFLVVLMFLKPSKPQKDDQLMPGSIISKLRRVDFVGAVLLGCSIVSLLLFVHFASQLNASLKVHIIVSGVLTIILGICFCLFEKRFAAEPIFPISLLTRRDIFTSYLIGLFLTAAQVAMLFTVPIYFSLAEGLSAGAAGSRLLPSVIFNPIGNFTAAFFIRRTGRYKTIAIIGTISGCVCYGLLAARWRGNINILELLYLVPGGWGLGVIQATGFVILAAGMESSKMSVATSGLYTSLSVGNPMGIGFATAVLNGSLRGQLLRQLADYPDRDHIISKAVSDARYVRSLSGALRNVVLKAYLTSITYMNVVSLAFSVLALLVSFLIREHDI